MNLVKLTKVTCACIVLIAGACAPHDQDNSKSRVLPRSISFPITYADSKVPGVMFFINEDEGMIVPGNREPGLWRIMGPPLPSRIQRCHAKGYKCLTGVAEYHPIVVGDMNIDQKQEFVDLGIAVVRRASQICDTFESTSLSKDDQDWRQTVIFCQGLGVVQISLYQDNQEASRIDLKSGQGLLSSGGLITIEPYEPPR